MLKGLVDIDMLRSGPVLIPSKGTGYISAMLYFVTAIMS